MVHLGLLESLGIELSDWTCGTLCRVLQLSTSLRQAAWGRLFRCVLSRNMPWEQLSTITLIFAVDSEEIFTSLSRCCRFEVPHADLRVRALQSRNSTVLLPSLMTLRTLAVRHGSSGPPPQGWVSICDLLSRSSCHLQGFKCDFDEDEVIDVPLSRCVTSLTDLFLSIPASDKFLNALAYKDRQQPSAATYPAVSRVR